MFSLYRCVLICTCSHELSHQIYLNRLTIYTHDYEELAITYHVF